MAETFDFVTTDAAQIYTAIIGTLMDEVGEPLYRATSAGSSERRWWRSWSPSTMNSMTR